MGAGKGKAQRAQRADPGAADIATGSVSGAAEKVTSSTGVKLWLDDIREPPDGTWSWVKTAADARELMLKGDVVLASLDHDLGVPNEDDLRETGYWFVLWMAEHDIWPSENVLVHSGNVVGVKKMTGVVERYGPYGE